MNSLPTKENNMNPQNLAAMNLLPQHAAAAAYRSHLSIEEIPTSANSSVIKPVTKEPKGAQFTIFYAGQVIVFDDFPMDKAKEIMSYASKGISQSQNNSAPSFPPNMVTSSANSSSPFPINANIIPNTGKNSAQEQPQAPPSRSVVHELPIARKASLHLFLEKRKDRIAARAPYQKSSSKEETPNETAESMPWLALAAKPP